MEYLILTGAIAFVIGTTRGLTHVMDAPVATPAPQPEIPVQWGTSTVPDMQQVWPRSHTPANRMHHSVSAFSVISEPSTVGTGFQPSQSATKTASNAVTQSDTAEPDVVALMSLTPFETVGTVCPDEFQLFSLLKEQRKKQSECIKTLYHIGRGGTEAYDRARNRYLYLLKLYLETKES